MSLTQGYRENFLKSFLAGARTSSDSTDMFHLAAAAGASFAQPFHHTRIGNLSWNGLVAFFKALATQVHGVIDRPALCFLALRQENSLCARVHCAHTCRVRLGLGPPTHAQTSMFVILRNSRRSAGKGNRRGEEIFISHHSPPGHHRPRCVRLSRSDIEVTFSSCSSDTATISLEI